MNKYFCFIFYSNTSYTSLVSDLDIVGDLIPVCTLSPISSSDILTDLPLSSLTIDDEGKHPHCVPNILQKAQQPQAGHCK